MHVHYNLKCHLVSQVHFTIHVQQVAARDDQESRTVSEQLHVLELQEQES